jgi:trimeric autotransporter adhesin
MAKDTINTDDIQISFDDAASTGFVPNEDAAYQVGSGQVSLSSLSSDNIALAINKLALPKQKAEAIGLNVNAITDGVYSFNLTDIQGLSKLYDVLLIDSYRNTWNDMRQNKTYRFDIYKNDTSSYGSKRFSLIIRQNPAFAYSLLSFVAEKTNKATQVQVSWTSANEENYTHFTVERSIDNGKTFDIIGSVPSNGLGSYSLLDKNPANGENLYRLKQEDVNNEITYSSVVKVSYSDNSNSLAKDNISVYPNPSKTIVNLNIQPVEIANSFGLLVRQAISSQTTWQSNVNDLLPGTYLVKVFDNNSNALVGNTKFIKL